MQDGGNENDFLNMLTGEDGREQEKSEKKTQENLVETAHNFHQALSDLQKAIGELQPNTQAALVKRNSLLNLPATVTAVESLITITDQLEHGKGSAPSGESIANLIKHLDVLSGTIRIYRGRFEADEFPQVSPKQKSTVSAIETYIQRTVMIELNTFCDAWKIEIPKRSVI